MSYNDKPWWLVSDFDRSKYCEFCGKELIYRKTNPTKFDKYSGKQFFWHEKKCPDYSFKPRGVIPNPHTQIFEEKLDE